MSWMIAWTLNAVYLAVLVLASPWLIWSAFKHGKYREGFGEKLFGCVPRRTGCRPCVWLHAVSVGEVNLLATTLAQLAKCRPHVEFFISTTTKAGYELAKEKYTAHTVFYCPLDFSWATRIAMRRVRPDLLVLAELELWPNLINAAKEQGARVAIINGRLSDRSFRGYYRLRPLVARVLARLDLVAAQNEETADRFCKLGASAECVRATGSLKFDGAVTDRNNVRTQQLRALAGLEANDVVWLVGSTQSPEEEMAIRIYQELAREFPRLKLVIVPRHPQRFDQVAELLERSQVDWSRRTDWERLAAASRSTLHRNTPLRTRGPAVILVDTVGELGAWWGTAAVGFVGGSFGSRGGQNMLEPAAMGVATCFGPNTWNFRDIVGQLLGVEGAVVVRDEHELAAFVRRLLADPAWGAKLGDRARRLVLREQGATARTVDLLLLLLGDELNARPQAA